MEYLRQNPYVYVPRGQGRKALPIRDDVREKRITLLRRRSQLIARLKKCKFPDDLIKSIRLEQEIGEIEKEVESLGGKPVNWK
jgi:hypothetical protein